MAPTHGKLEQQRSMPCLPSNKASVSGVRRKKSPYIQYDNSDYLELKKLTWENKWIHYPLKAVIYLFSLLLTSALSSSWRWKHLPLKKLGKCGRGMLAVPGHSSSLSTSVSSSYGLVVLTLPVQILHSSTLFYGPSLPNRIYTYRHIQKLQNSLLKPRMTSSIVFHHQEPHHCYLLSQSSEFFSHSPLCCFSVGVCCCAC